MHRTYTVSQRIIYLIMAVMTETGVRRLNNTGLDGITLLIMLSPLFIYTVYATFIRKKACESTLLAAIDKTVGNAKKRYCHAALFTTGQVQWK